jgi:hypothetical protein
MYVDSGGRWSRIVLLLMVVAGWYRGDLFAQCPVMGPLLTVVDLGDTKD